MPAASRQGDPGRIHCSSWRIANGSADVQINGRPAARLGDKTTSHLGPKCFPHTAKISQGAATISYNGRPAARIGSAVADCTVVIGGSENVDAGGPSTGGGGSGFGALASIASLAFSVLAFDGAIIPGIGGSFSIGDLEANSFA